MVFQENYDRRMDEWRDKKATDEAAAKLLAPKEPIPEIASEDVAALVLAAEPSPESVAVAVEEPPTPVSDRVELTGDFSDIAHDFYAEIYGEKSKGNSVGAHWLRRRRAKVGLPPKVDISELQFGVYISIYEFGPTPIDYAEFDLNENLCFPPGIAVKRGRLGEITIKPRRSAEIVRDYFFISPDASSLDINSAQLATEEEAFLIFNPPVVEPELEIRTFARTPRTAGDPANYLGFVVNDGGQDVRFSRFWCWKAFHLSAPSIIGALQHSAESLKLKLFDAQGEPLLTISTKTQLTEFDQVRLEPGDYLLAFLASGSGNGTIEEPASRRPDCGAFRFLPKRPLLDELTRQSPLTHGELELVMEQMDLPVRVPVPNLRFWAT
jgi:hypothetical protein